MIILELLVLIVETIVGFFANAANTALLEAILEGTNLDQEE